MASDDAAQKRPGPSGSPVFGSLRRCASSVCRSGHTAFVAPGTDPKSGTPNKQFYCFATPISDAEILLIDKSPPAIKTARENRRRLRIRSNRTRIQQEDFSVFAGRTGKKFEMIVSNPPYISLTERRNLPKEVRREPEAALFGGPDGLDFIRILITESRKILAAGGYLIFEIGYGQAERTVSLLEKAGFKLDEVIKDLAGIDRVVICQKSM